MEIEAAAVMQQPRLAALDLSRQVMVEACDQYIEELGAAPLNEVQRDYYAQRLARGLMHLSGLMPGQEIAIDGASSVWLLDDDGLRDWGALDGRQQLRAHIETLFVAPWYELLVGRRLSAADVRRKRRGEGLWIELQAARLVALSGTVTLLGRTAVPLHHGEPVLYRVIQQGDC